MRAAIMLLCAAALLPGQDRTASRTPDVGTGVNQAVVDYYDSLSDYFRMSNRAIQAMGTKGIPDEELAAVLTVTKNSRASANDVIDARKKGMSWEQIAQKHNMKMKGGNFVEEANLEFLSQYHGRAPEEVKKMHDKGASFIDINQQYRRVGVKPRTEKAAEHKH